MAGEESEMTDGQQTPGSPERVERLNKQQGRAQIRRVIDILFISGVDPGEVQEMMEELADGVPYYAEDIRRYNDMEITEDEQ